MDSSDDRQSITREVFILHLWPGGGSPVFCRGRLRHVRTGRVTVFYGLAELFQLIAYEVCALRSGQKEDGGLH